MERQGFVQVREELLIELPWHRYGASWQPNPNGPADRFYSEDGAGWNELEKAVEWGRRHAPIVYVRVGPGLSEWYNAGEKDDHAGRPTQRWPGSRRRRAKALHPDYAGVVYVDEEQPNYFPAGRFSAVWASESEEWLDNAEGFEDVETAIDWGRERAPVVLVAELPTFYQGVPTFPTYEIRSAGEQDPPGERLERLRPTQGQETMQWMFSSREDANDAEPDRLCRLFEDALRKDDTVSEPVCRVREDDSRFWSGAAEGGDHLASWSPPAWIDISFRVSAPTRKRAFEVALDALLRARDPGDATVSAFVGRFTLRALG